MGLMIPPHLERKLRERVASGLYKDEMEALGQAIDLLQEVDTDPAFRRRLLIAELQKGEDDIHAGRYRVFDTEDELKAFAETLL
jgi:Arc/MetJ-type ribon-helix-helix transcriptional regulator